MTRVQNIAGLPPTWLVTCDVPSCSAQEALLSVHDVTAIVVGDELDPVDVPRREHNLVRAVACGRGWVPGTHVGEPDHWRCPAHAGVLRVR